MAESGGSIGFLTFAAWVFSVLAAVMAIDMYSLLRTGEFGRSWRVIIIASVILALTLGLRLGEIVDFVGLAHSNLSQIGGLMFVMSLAYAIFLQRQVFTNASRLRRRDTDHEDDLAGLLLRRESRKSDADATPSRPHLTLVRDGDIPHSVPPSADATTAPAPLNASEEDDNSDIEWSRSLNARGR